MGSACSWLNAASLMLTCKRYFSRSNSRCNKKKIRCCDNNPGAPKFLSHCVFASMTSFWLPSPSHPNTILVGHIDVDLSNVDALFQYKNHSTKNSRTKFLENLKIWVYLEISQNWNGYFGPMKSAHIFIQTVSHVQIPRVDTGQNATRKLSAVWNCIPSTLDYIGMHIIVLGFLGTGHYLTPGRRGSRRILRGSFYF